MKQFLFILGFLLFIKTTNLFSQVTFRANTINNDTVYLERVHEAANKDLLIYSTLIKGSTMVRLTQNGIIKWSKKYEVEGLNNVNFTTTKDNGFLVTGGNWYREPASKYLFLLRCTGQ